MQAIRKRRLARRALFERTGLWQAPRPGGRLVLLAYLVLACLGSQPAGATGNAENIANKPDSDQRVSAFDYPSPRDFKFGSDSYGRLLKEILDLSLPRSDDFLVLCFPPFYPEFAVKLEQVGKSGARVTLSLPAQNMYQWMDLGSGEIVWDSVTPKRFGVTHHTVTISGPTFEALHESWNATLVHPTPPVEYTPFISDLYDCEIYSGNGNAAAAFTYRRRTPSGIMLSMIWRLHDLALGEGDDRDRAEIQLREAADDLLAALAKPD